MSEVPARVEEDLPDLIDLRRAWDERVNDGEVRDKRDGRVNDEVVFREEGCERCEGVNRWVRWEGERGLLEGFAILHMGWEWMSRRLMRKRSEDKRTAVYEGEGSVGSILPPGKAV